MVLQRRPRSLRLGTACGCSPCSSLAPPPAIPGSRSPADAPSAQFVVPAISPAATHSPRGFCIVSPAVHLPAGRKFCPWAPLENVRGSPYTSYLRALVVLVLAFLFKNVRPAGAFKGVVLLVCHGRRADLRCAVAELADAGCSPPRYGCSGFHGISKIRADGGLCRLASRLWSVL